MRILFIISAVLVLVSSCNNKYKQDVYVFKSMKNDSVNLLVNNKNIGYIPYIDTNQVDLTSNAVLFSLGTGKHEISAMDKKGNYLSSVIVDISNKKMNMGAVNYSKNNTTVTIVNNDNKYFFKNRSGDKGYFMFSLE